MFYLGRDAGYLVLESCYNFSVSNSIYCIVRKIHWIPNHGTLTILPVINDPLTVRISYFKIKIQF